LIPVFTHVLGALVVRTGIDPKRATATVTVPSSFAAAQREATVLAAHEAGLGEVRLLKEPLATAHAYLRCGTRCERAFVSDLGGGTFDCAVVNCTSDAPAVLAHSSDLTLGGDDVDHRLAAWVRHSVIEKYNWDLASYAEVYDRVLSECELAKIELATGRLRSSCSAGSIPMAPRPTSRLRSRAGSSTCSAASCSCARSRPATPCCAGPG
jgi:hypothetical protein